MPIYTIIAGAVVAGLIFALRVPFFLIGLLSLILLGVTLYIHINLYAIDYRTVTFGSSTSSMATGIIASAIAIMAIGYIFMLQKGKNTSSAYGNRDSSSKSWFSYGDRDSSSKSWFSYGDRDSSSKPWFSYGSNDLRRRRSSDFTGSQQQNYLSALERLI